MNKTYIFIIILISSTSFSQKYSKQIHSDDKELVFLHHTLKNLYKGFENSNCLKLREITPYEKWIISRRYLCKYNEIECIKNLYKKQIAKFKKPSQKLLKARQLFKNSLIPGELSLKESNRIRIIPENKIIYFNDLSQKFEHLPDTKIKKNIERRAAIYTITCDINNDGLPDIILYQILGSANCLRFSILMKKNNSTYEQLNNYDFCFDDTAFCGSILKVIQISGNQFLYLQDIYDGEVIITLYDFNENVENISIYFSINKESKNKKFELIDDMGCY